MARNHIQIVNMKADDPEDSIGLGKAALEDALKVCSGRDPQSRLVELHAFADGVIHHFRDITAALGERQEIHASHLFAEGADMEVALHALEMS
jgi:hypothetical protein